MTQRMQIQYHMKRAYDDKQLYINPQTEPAEYVYPFKSQGEADMWTPAWASCLALSIASRVWLQYNVKEFLSFLK